MLVKSLVDRGLELRRQIETATAELKTVEAALVAQAEQGDHVPLEDKDREGRQYLAEGSTVIVPVVFTADKIIASFANDGHTHKRISLLVGVPTLKLFYEPETKWQMRAKDGKAFRKSAAELLGLAAPKFITACKQLDKNGVPKSDIKIEWEAAKEIT